MDVDIRAAMPSDADQIVKVHLASIEGLAGQAYDEEQVSAWAHDRDPADYPIESSGSCMLVATRGADIVGFGWLKTETGDYFSGLVDGEITALYVHPDVAGQGVGTRLYAELEAAARDKGIETLGLWASRNSVPFYESQGYQHVTDQTVEYDDVELAVVEMQKRMSGRDER